ALVLGVMCLLVGIMMVGNPKPSLICDDYIGAPLPPGAERGVQCQCAGIKLYLQNTAPSDGRDLSICLGLIKETNRI
ncbi:MAG: hypothetical protein KDD43_12710, partial [Bdellovibrionales bacterium]|nr:hypothetical protein [Bdellovibrionales bacterium]